MQKYRSEGSGFEGRHSRKATFSLPEIVTIDALATMPDEDLIGRLRALEEEKSKAYEAHVDVRSWEEEIAYIRREQQIRRTRRDAQMEYNRKVESEFAQSEAGLPAGDFDNSVFVYAATGGRPRWN